MTRSFTSKYILLLLCLTAIVRLSVQAQSEPINGQLYGEPILSTGSILTEMPGGGGIRENVPFIATSNKLYMLVGDQQTGSLMQVGYYQNGWQAPTGTTIKEARIKKKLGTGFYIEILLTDGSVYQMNPFSYPWQTQQVGSITDTVSQTFEKIVGDDLYVLSTSHLYVTRDSGTSWQLDEAGTSGTRNDVAVDTGQNVFMATSTGLYKQTPTGNTWSSVSGVPGGGRVFADRRDRILLSGNFTSALYLSPDDGATWNMDTIGLNQYLVKQMADDIYGNLYVVAYNLSTYPAHDMVFRSLRGTAPWQQVDAGLNTLINGPFTINSIGGDSVLILGTNFGFFYSLDSGQTWGMNNRGVQAGYLTTLVKQNNGRLVTTSPLGLYVIDVNDTAWHKTYPTTSYDGRLLVYGDSSTGTLYLQDQQTSYGQSSLLYNSTDNGNTWNIDTIGLYGVKAGNMYVDEQGTQYLTNSSYGSTQHAAIYDRGTSGSPWTLDSAGIPWVSYTTITTLCSDKHGYLYASMSLGVGNSPIMRRPIAGGTWVLDTAGIPAGTSIQYMASSSATGIVAASGTSLYRRSGGAWLSVPLPSQLSTPILIAVSVDGRGAIFASFYDNNHSYGDGVFFTTDNGNTWTYAGLQDLYVEHLISYGDTTYALTYDSWGYKLTETAYNGIIDPANVINMSPVKAYPNPSQSGIWTVSIPEEWLGSKIEVSDMSGRVVYDGILSKTESRLTLQEDGVYILHVEGMNGKATTRLVK